MPSLIQRTSWLLAACASCCISPWALTSDLDTAGANWGVLMSRLGHSALNDSSMQSASPETVRTVNEIRERILANTLSDDQWKDLLIPERLFLWRPMWIKGEPLAVQLVRPPWLGRTFEIRATPRLDHGQTLRTGRTWAGPCGLANNDLATSEPPFNGVETCGVVGVLPDSAASVVFDLEIRTGAEVGAPGGPSFSSKQWADSRVVRNVTVSFDIQQVDRTDVAKVMEPTRQCNAAEIIRPTVYHHGWSDGSVHAYLLLDLDRRVESCPDVGFGLHVELLKDDQPVESVDIPGWTFWERASGCFSCGHQMFETLLNKEAELTNPEEMKHWSIRITGSDRMAWSSWSHRKYWNGILTMPMSAVYADPQARQLGFTTIRIGAGVDEQ